MGQTLLSLSLHNKRDAMIARQRTRQLAGLLGFDFHAQAGMAASVFAVAWQILQVHTPAQLKFSLENDVLKISTRPRRQKGTATAQPRCDIVVLEKHLPGPAKTAIEDLIWAVNKLDQLTPAHMYEEVFRLNQELLDTLQALHACQAQLSLLEKTEKTSAA